MRPDRSRPGLGARPGVVVDHPRLRAVDDLEAVAPHSLAPIDVFKIEEVALIHQPHVAHRPPADVHRRAQDPVDGACLLVIPFRHEVRAHRPAPLGERAQRHAAEEQRPPIVESARGKLKGPVGVQEPGSENSGARMRLGRPLGASSGRAEPDVGFRISTSSSEDARIPSFTPRA